MQDRRVAAHRVLDVDDVRQHLVLDLDQVERLLGDRRRDRGDGGDRMAVIQHLAARHAVARQVAEIHRPFADKCLFRGDLGEIGGGDDRLDAGQRQRPSTVSIDMMRACACGLRLTLPHSMPGIAMSAPNAARPMTLSTPSGRIGRVPTTFRRCLIEIGSYATPERKVLQFLPRTAGEGVEQSEAGEGVSSW